MHITPYFIPPKNSRTSLYRWLKGFCNTSTYSREISKQSWVINFRTPCRCSWVQLGGLDWGFDGGFPILSKKIGWLRILYPFTEDLEFWPGLKWPKEWLSILGLIGEGAMRWNMWSIGTYQLLLRLDEEISRNLWKLDCRSNILEHESAKNKFLSPPKYRPFRPRGQRWILKPKTLSTSQVFLHLFFLCSLVRGHIWQILQKSLVIFKGPNEN